MARAAPYNGLKGSFWITLERPGQETLKGEAAIEMKGSQISMHVYRMGFLVGTLLNPEDPKYRYLVEAFREALLWWNITGYRTDRAGGRLVLTTYDRTLELDAKSLAPLKQTIRLRSELNNGAFKEGEAVATYSDYDDIDQGFPLWYPGSLHIEYPRYTIDLRVEKITLGTSSPEENP